MSESLAFNTDFSQPPGRAAAVSPLVRRVVAGNAGPFTFTGTCSYIVGRGGIAVVDPGPDSPEHLSALLAAIGGDTVEAILVTHTHKDHSPLARALHERTGAPIVGCGPHRPARPAAGEGRLDTSGDEAHLPHRELFDGDAVSGPGWTLRAVATPGHTANHLAFALEEEQSLFSGDHVMAWSTTVVAPPDGAMRDYMDSLQRLASRSDRVFWPGHGGPVTDPPRFTRALLTHRRQREGAILERVRAGDGTIGAIVPRLYPGLTPALVGAAGLSVLAHLQDLAERGLVVADDALHPETRFRAA